MISSYTIVSDEDFSIEESESTILFVTTNSRMNWQNDPKFSRISDIAKKIGFNGEKGKTVNFTLAPENHTVVLTGLGKQESYGAEVLRRAYSSALNAIRSIKSGKVNVVPPNLDKNEIFEIAYISELALYAFDQYMEKKVDPAPGEIRIISGHGTPEDVRLAGVIAEATNFTRSLANLPASIGTPTLIESRVMGIPGLKVTVLNREEFIKLGMGGVEAVSRGSKEPAKVLVMEYDGSDKRPVLLVGKGITFDSGGISIKPWESMGEMKFDKCGAMTVIGIMKLLTDLKPAMHVVGITPLTENLPGGNAYKPGDIVRHYNGKTSEIISTDAEGRLVLADALSYGIEKFDPVQVIDFATLTGASIMALGKHKAGLFCNDRGMETALHEAASRTWENLWNLPLDDDYRDQIKSEVADIMNVGGKWGGSSTAAAFLDNFVDGRPWAHIDFPGVAYVGTLDRRLPYLTLGATGFGVRLIYEYLTAME